jgi:hypothetical protein
LAGAKLVERLWLALGIASLVSRCRKTALLFAVVPAKLSLHSSYRSDFPWLRYETLFLWHSGSHRGIHVC